MWNPQEGLLGFSISKNAFRAHFPVLSDFSLSLPGGYFITLEFVDN